MSALRALEVYREEAVGAAGELVQKNLHLVRRSVARIRPTLPRTVEDDDLIGYGLLGLLEASQRFDPERGVPFEAFAYYRIRGAIMDGLRLMGWLPRGLYQRTRKLTTAISELEERKGRPPTEDEVAAYLGVTAEEYEAVLAEAAPVTLLPLDELTEEAEAHDEASWRQLEREELRQALAVGIGALPKNEKLVVTLYFYEMMTLKEIAVVMEVTEGRVCQIKTQAMLRLQARLRRQGWEE